MRILTTLTVLIYFLGSCSTTSEKKSIDGVIAGEWVVESFSSAFVHAVISVPMADTLEIPKYRITPYFSIHFKEDNLYVLANKNGPTRTGGYRISDISLALSLNSDSTSWLNFGIDSITDNRLYLTSKSIPFYSRKADTLDFFTADDITFILKRK